MQKKCMRTRGILIQVKNPFLEPSCHDNTCLIKRAELTKISCRYRVSPGVAMFSLPPATRAIKKVKIACCFFAFPQGKNGKIQCACIKCFFPGGAALFFVTTRTVKTVKTFFFGRLVQRSTGSSHCQDGGQEWTESGGGPRRSQSVGSCVLAR